MKTTLITTIAAAALLLAGASFAQDFHPILDADYLGHRGIDASVGARLSTSNPGPHSDSEWGGEALTAADSTKLVPASFHPLLDADFLSGHPAVSEASTSVAMTTGDAGTGMTSESR